jgi:uncharacterized membrane protein
MDWLVKNYVLVIGLVIIAAGAGISAYRFTRKSNEQRIAAIREWLKYAVTVSEAAMQSGTGALKLQYVWSMATAQFPFIAKLISFEEFKIMVDDALVWMREQFEKNPNIKAVVIGITPEEEQTN